jgi:glutathione S-transferase
VARVPGFWSRVRPLSSLRSEMQESDRTSHHRPYFGQAAWFRKSHSEKIPSAIERYDNEIKRVFGVLELVLAERPSGYLVGDKATIADLSFITWNNSATNWLEVEGLNFEKDFPLTAK